MIPRVLILHGYYTAYLSTYYQVQGRGMGSDGKQGDGCKHASKRRLKVWPPAELHETIIHKNSLDSRQTELRLA